MEDCILWLGHIDKDGYGRLGPKLAHRVIYEREIGPIPSGLQLDHLCRVRSCVNTSHLEPVTKKENQRRGMAGDLRTSCKRGHPFNVQNTKIYKGYRYCRLCNREAVARYAARRSHP